MNIHHKATWLNNNQDFSVLSSITEENGYTEAEVSIRDGRDYVNIWLNPVDRNSVYKIDELINHLKEFRDSLAKVVDDKENKD